MRCLYFEKRQIGLFMNTQYRSLKDLPGMVGLEFERRVCWVRGQDHADALRSFHNVSVSEDVAVRIDNDAGANRMLTGNSRRRVFMIFQRPVSSHHKLDDYWGYFRHNYFQEAIQSPQ